MRGEDYLENKKRKIQEQQETIQISKLFANLCFYFDGFFKEPVYELSRLVKSHSAATCNVNSSCVSHIIADSCSLKKLNDVKKPIVTVEWIYNSITHQKLLDFRPFQLNTSSLQPSILSSTIPCTNPLFISSYFLNSRLHHLSTWKTELLNHVQRLFPHPLSVKNKPNRIILHVDMDCFFASVSLLSRPHLVSLPVAIAHASDQDNSTSSTSEIASCNYIARQSGVKNGMIISKAKLSCPNIRIVPYG